MGLTKKIFLILITFLGNLSWSQDSIPALVSSDSIKYKVQFSDKITGRLFFVNTSNSVNVQSRNQDVDYNLIPNKQDRLGASIAFRAIALSFSFAPSFLSENKDNEDSRLFNLRLKGFFGQWLQTFNLYEQKGFFIEIPELGIDSYLPKVKSLKIGGSTSYIFNENFSYRAIVSQDEKQLVSAGTFMPTIVYYYTKYDLIDDTIDEDFHSYDLAFAPSYTYNWVPSKNFLISAGGSVGIGVNYSKTETESLTSILTELNFRGSIVYDKNNLYLGGHYSYLVLNHNADRTTYIKDNIPYFELFIGYRFKAPKKLVAKANTIDEKLHLKK